MSPTTALSTSVLWLCLTTASNRHPFHVRPLTVCNTHRIARDRSSIFRCLGGLWNIPRGTIRRPGGLASGLHQECFYVPQKPYNVLGTLVEQLTCEPSVCPPGSFFFCHL